jgi:type II secretory pathway pseudopilin PulG
MIDPRAGERGVTLIEATVVLSVAAILAAMMAPGINGYIEQARQARTRQDVQSIAEAVQQFITDTGEHQFLRDASNGATDSTPPTRLDTNRVDMLVGDGDVPARATAVTADSIWTQAVDGTVVDTISNHLIENTPGESTNQRYRNPTDVTVATPGGNNIDFARAASSGFNAPHAWRGPYLRGPVDSDPWGNRYAVNVAFLDTSATDTRANFTNGGSPALFPRFDVFVLSAGADEEVDTAFAQDGAVPGDDDFIYLVASHAK